VLSFLWLLLLTLGLCVLMLPYAWQHWIHSDVTQAALYAALHRPLFILLLAFICLTAISGNAGWFGRALCHPMFVPFSRLSLCLFAIHPLIIIIRHHTQRQPLVFSHSQFVRSSLSLFDRRLN
jgi:hypothetical protein